MESNFIKKAREQGRVIDYNENVFLDTSLIEASNENNFYIGEGRIPFNSYETGDIVYVEKFEYTSGRSGSNHLFVVVDENNYAISLEYFGLLISSRLDKLKYKENILLKKNNSNNLKKDSLVKTDAIYSLKPDNIIYNVGKTTLEQVKLFKEMFLKYGYDYKK